ncbi:unnamed protein product [Closterium sp. Yama58-4]|nr:unnamed protein product [Closterium sp. Yama58-4]
MAETSITTLWPWKVRELAEKEKEGSVFQLLRRDVTRFLTTILIGTTLVNIWATALVTDAATALFGEAGVSAATGVMTILLLVFTEIAPKSIAVHNATQVVRVVLRPVAWLSVVLYPVGRLCTYASTGLFRLLGLKTSGEPFVTEEELKLMLRGAEMSGAIEEEEQDMIENVLEIKDTYVREVMTPLVDVVAVSSSASLMELRALWVRHQYSRVPVYERRVDNIVGIAYAMDMLDYVEQPELLHRLSVGRIAHRPAYFVPDSMSVWNLLREFRIRKVHMAIVLNEYGGTVGLVTLEDAVEEIVGEIFDENDSKEEIRRKTGYIIQRAEGVYDVDANTTVDDLADILQVVLPPRASFYETVSGFVCEAFGYIPRTANLLPMRPRRALASLLRVLASPAIAARPSTLEAPRQLVSAAGTDSGTRGTATACQVALDANRVSERAGSAIATEFATDVAAAASGAASMVSYIEPSCIEASPVPASHGWHRAEEKARGWTVSGADGAGSAEKARGWTVAVEGNIGVGKSTVLSALGERLISDVALRKAVTGGADVALLPEPLREWRNVRGSGANALDAFYKDPKRFAYTFQSLVFISRASQYGRGLHHHPLALRLCERSLFCDRLVFAPAAVAGGLFTPLEEALYDSWVDAVLPMLPGVFPMAFRQGGAGESRGGPGRPDGPPRIKDGSWISADARNRPTGWASQMGRAKRLKPRMWKSAFDAEGRLVRMPQVLKAILEGGVDKSIRGEVWEFLLGCFSLESTAEERNYVREARRERYQQLLLQCQQMHSNVGSGHLAFAVGTRIMDVRIIHPGNTPGNSGTAPGSSTANIPSPATTSPSGEAGGSGGGGRAGGGSSSRSNTPPDRSVLGGAGARSSASGGSSDLRYPPSRQYSERGSAGSSTQLRLDQLIEEGGPRLSSFSSFSFSCDVDMFDLDDPRGLFVRPGGEEEDEEDLEEEWEGEAQEGMRDMDEEEEEEEGGDGGGEAGREGEKGRQGGGGGVGGEKGERGGKGEGVEGEKGGSGCAKDSPREKRAGKEETGVGKGEGAGGKEARERKKGEMRRRSEDVGGRSGGGAAEASRGGKGGGGGAGGGAGGRASGIWGGDGGDEGEMGAGEAAAGG